MARRRPFPLGFRAASRPGRRGIVSAAALLVALLATSTATASGSPRPARRAPVAAAGLRWAPCTGHGSFRCARLRVPLSYARPSGPSIALAVAELPATGPRPVGDLVMNPGGPGASGVQFLEQEGSAFPAALRRSFNLVSFDPRGIGESNPVRCVGASGIRKLVAIDPAPVDAAQVRQVVAATKAFIAACVAHTPRALLENVSTSVTAKDLDRLRAALGQPKLDYLGFSYGTYLGEVYARDFPGRVRAMVLDGVVDPALPTAATDLAQAKGFEVDLHDFFAWCPTNAACSRELAGGAKAAYDRLFGQLAGGASVPAYLKPRYGGTQRVTLGVAETALAAALYAKSEWPLLAKALASGLQGDGTLLAYLAYSYAGLQQDGSYSNLIAANVAINCVDRPGPTSLGVIERLSQQMARAAPDFGASIAWSELTCAYWPVRPQGRVGLIRAPGAPTILVVGSTGDPATPYGWATAVAHQLDHAVLLTRSGPGHTAYFSSACVRSAVGAYLSTLRTPRPGTVCPSN